MKFWYSSTSPFARKVYVTILHHHLEEQVDIQKVQVAFDKNSPHNQDNPLAKEIKSSPKSIDHFKSNSD